MSQHLIIKSADLVVAPTRGELDVRSILHTLPLGKGWVFGLFTLEHKEDLAKERLAHILKSHLEHLAADLADDTNVVRRFEQTLSRVNRDLARAAADTHLNIDKFHVVIGVLAGEQIFMSGSGKLQALFLHKTAEQRYVIYELDAQFHDQPDKNWNKPLIAVLDGEFQSGDIFYLATPVSHQILSIDELQDILITLPPTGALQRIRQFLPATEHYGGLAFQAVATDTDHGARRANPISSLRELENTKQQTASVLGDQQPDFVKTLQEIVGGISKKLSSPGMRGFQNTCKRGLALFIKGLSHSLTWLAKIAIKLLAIIKQRWSDGRSNRALRHGLGPTRLSNRPGLVGAARAAMHELSAPRKLALLGFMLVMVILGGVIFLSGDEAKTNKVEVAFQSLVQVIEEQILAAEASLIYHNATEAERSLKTAATALETLPRDTSEHTTKADALATSLASLQAKIRGVTLATPTKLADLRDIEENASLLTVTLTPNGIVALADNLATYELKATERNWLKINVINGPISRSQAITTFGADVIAVDATQQLARLDLPGLTLNPITSGANNLASVEDIFVYNDSLYVLTAASQQVVKMRPQLPNFEAGTAWIDAHTTDLTSARALAIDSDIYILLTNDVRKFTSGREQTWRTATIDPPLLDAVDLWTSFESAYLYILDPVEKRVLVIDKSSGAVRAQYVADAFASAVGFVIEEATSKITVITATEALEFTPQHLIQ